MLIISQAIADVVVQAVAALPSAQVLASSYLPELVRPSPRSPGGNLTPSIDCGAVPSRRSVVVHTLTPGCPGRDAAVEQLRWAMTAIDVQRQGSAAMRHAKIVIRWTELTPDGFESREAPGRALWFVLLARLCVQLSFHEKAEDIGDLCVCVGMCESVTIPRGF